MIRLLKAGHECFSLRSFMMRRGRLPKLNTPGKKAPQASQLQHLESQSLMSMSLVWEGR